MNCIAIDDEPLALSLLRDNIEKVAFLKLIATCSNAMDGIEILQQEQIDLIFVDIQMPRLSGLQFISSLERKPLVIFVTAYKEYAVQSYDLNVVDYLVKPVPLERFVKACHRAKEQYELRRLSPRAPAPNKDYFFVPADYSQVKINYADVIWISGYGDYLKFHLKNTQHPLVVRMSFKDLEHELSTAIFLRIHKSHMVHIDAITSVRKNSLLLGEMELPIGETYRKTIEEKLHL